MAERLKVVYQSVVYPFRDNNGKKEVLLIEQGRGMNKGFLNGVGGHAKTGETPLDCAIRETREETGVRIDSSIDMLGNLSIIVGNRQLTLYAVSFFRPSEFSGEIRASDEGRLNWFDTEELPYGRMLPSNRLVIDWIVCGRRFTGTTRISDGLLLSADIKLIRR